jgi:peptidoglycan/LPS O-acetylase OafA/YrhL
MRLNLVSMFWYKFSNLFNAKNNIPVLDGLRGLAVLVVVFSHISASSANINLPIFNFVGIGKLGVYLFFVLSSYLLDSQIINELQKNGLSWFYWKNYFLRRILRIYPLFILSLLIFFTLSKFGFKSVINTKTDIIYHIFLIHGDSIFWSILVEFKYYFISPLIMIICHYLKWKPKYILILISFIILVSIIIQHEFKFDTNSLIRYLPIFLVGTLLAIFEKYLITNFIPQKSSTLLIFSFSIFLFFILFIPSYLFYFLDFEYHFEDDYSFHLIHGLFWAIILFSVKNIDSNVFRFFSSKFMMIIGKISFSIYLFHIPILGFCISNKIGIPFEFKLISFAFLLLIFCVNSFFLFELPISRIRFKK